MQMPYNPQKMELKWQKFWADENLFRADENSKKEKFYCLEMLPYPSGRIHMGHVRNYTIGDVVARYKTMKGFSVLHPMGWDAFGLPAENAAIKNKIHPAKWTHENIGTMRTQLKRMGFSYDWEREFATCDPEYYRWEQFLFLKMFEKGLAYRKEKLLNWCESCKTVLANEQVEQGKCWRCSTVVMQKPLEQWFFKITDYAEELLKDIDDKLQGWPHHLPSGGTPASQAGQVVGWPERVRIMQKEWIGKSEGTLINFKIQTSKSKTNPKSQNPIEVFTTRPDTLFGVTFMSLACEHPQLMELAKAGGREKEVKKFVEKTLKMERMKRLTGEYEKEGEFTGSYCLHPVTGEKLPIYAANFVLMDYGTGAVMAVPAHDERDLAFAQKYKLPIQQMEPDPNAINIIEKQGFGSKTVQFRLKDWCLSRQRYWGAPIPIIYCADCGIVPVPEKDLPVKLPIDVPFTGEGGSPLGKIADFVNVSCPQCGKKARRETDTMDTFVESSWYLLRYCSPKYEKGMVDPKAVAYWMPVDQYIGGIEHAVGHLIYCRFFTKVMRDLGMIKLDEPVKNLLTQGMVCLGGSAMSKSKGNVIDPDDIIQHYGADTARIFILFAAPPEKDLEWNDEAVEGMYRFINRVWRLVTEKTEDRGPKTEDQKQNEWKNRTIKRVTEDIEKFQFNTAIAALMEYLNYLQTEDRGPKTEDLKTLVILLSPFAPHVAEELWEILGHKESILKTPWPKWDEKALQASTVTIVVQVNGKLRGSMEMPAGSDEAAVKEAALALEKVKPHLDGKQIVKTIFVPNKLLNVVVKG